MSNKWLGYDDYRTYLEALTEQLLKSLGDELISLVLYGSVARGEATLDSDLDLLVILREASSTYYDRLQPLLEVQRAVQRSSSDDAFRRKGSKPYVSYLVLSKQEAQKNRYIFLDMIEEARILYDRGGFFVGRLQQLKQRLAELGSRKIYLPDGSWYWDLKPDLALGEVFEL